MGGKRLDIKTGFVCNNNCRFCVQADNKYKGNRTTTEIKKDLEESINRCTGVVFTGGEVTIRKDIFELVSYAKQLGYKIIQIQSNCRMLSNIGFLKKLITAGANEFGPALHGPNAKVHDYLTRAPGSFDQTIKAIENLKKLKQPTLVNIVVVKQNYEYLPEIAKLLVKLGVDQFQFAFVHPVGNAFKNYVQIVPKMSLALPFIKKGLQVGIDARIRVMAEAIPYCMMQGYEEYISEKFIPETEIKTGISFDKDFSTTRQKQGKAKFQQCQNCVFNAICEGPWKEYPKKFGNKEFKPIKNTNPIKNKQQKPTILNLNNNLISVTKPYIKNIKKRILFINPPIEEPFIKLKYSLNKLNFLSSEMKKKILKTKDGIFIRKNYVYNLPIGLLRIANNLLKKGNEIYFLDCFASLPPHFPNSKNNFSKSDEPTIQISNKSCIHFFHLGLPYKNIIKTLKGIKIDEIYVGCTFTYHNKSAHKVIDICKKILPKTKINFGGIYPSLAPKHARKSNADKIFIGKYTDIKDKSINYKLLGYNPGYILMKGTSGCPHNCSYCAVHKLEGCKFKFRPPEEVLDEIFQAYQKYNINKVGIWDSNILINYDEYFGKILKKIQEKNIKLELFAPEGFDYRLINQQIANDLKKSGFSEVYLALENCDDLFVKNNLNRQNNIKQFKKSIKYLKKAGFEGHNIIIFIMIGLPNQTLKNIIKNIKFVWSLGCNVLFFPFTPIPGTQIYNKNYNNFKSFELKDLHPLLFSCTNKKKKLEYLIELNLLNIMNKEQKLQSKYFKQILFSKELINMFD